MGVINIGGRFHPNDKEWFRSYFLALNGNMTDFQQGGLERELTRVLAQHKKGQDTRGVYEADRALADARKGRTNHKMYLIVRDAFIYDSLMHDSSGNYIGDTLPKSKKAR